MVVRRADRGKRCERTRGDLNRGGLKRPALLGALTAPRRLPHSQESHLRASLGRDVAPRRASVSGATCMASTQLHHKKQYSNTSKSADPRSPRTPYRNIGTVWIVFWSGVNSCISPHALRREAATKNLNDGLLEEMARDRLDMSTEVLEIHCNAQTKEDKRALQREFFQNL